MPERSRTPNRPNPNPGREQPSTRLARYLARRADKLGLWMYDLLRRHWLGIVNLHLLAFVFGAVEAPSLLYLDQPWAAKLIYGFYGLFCHQQPSRCFFLFENPLAVCSRCLAFYSSMLVFGVGLSLKRVKPISLKSALVLAGPAAADVSLQAVSIAQSTNLVRVTTGLLLGMAVFLFLFPRIQRAVHRLNLQVTHTTREDRARVHG